MPITPRFDVSQTPSTVSVTVHTASSIRISSDTVQVVVEDACVLHVSAPPYLLRLSFAPRRFRTSENAEEGLDKAHGGGGGGGKDLGEALTNHEFSNPLVSVVDSTDFEGGECEPQSVVWDPSESTIVITLLKYVEDESDGHWSHLDMVARLVVPPASVAPKWLQAVVGEESGPKDANIEERYSDGEIDRDGLPGYGFANMFRGVLGGDVRQAGLAQELLQLDGIDAEESTAEDRRERRVQREQEDFDADRYISDHLANGVEEDYIYQGGMSFVAAWEADGNSSPEANLVDMLGELRIDGKRADGLEASTTSFFTSDERLQLATIPYPLLPPWCLQVTETSSKRMQAILCGLLDLLFAFVYDKLMTQDEPNVESAWTMSTLSSSLSWLDEMRSVDDVVCAAIRRSLIYPYLRNYELSAKAWRHVCSLLRHTNARRHVVRCLLQMRAILDRSESYYLCNKLYVDPYLAWLQRHNGDVTFAELAEDIERVLCLPGQEAKRLLCLQLVELESLYFGEDGDESSLEDEDERDHDDSGDSNGSDSDDSESDDSESDESEDGIRDDGSNGSKNISAYESVSPELLDANIGATPSILCISPNKKTDEVQTKPLIEELVDRTQAGRTDAACDKAT